MTASSRTRQPGFPCIFGLKYSITFRSAYGLLVHFLEVVNAPVPRALVDLKTDDYARRRAYTTPSPALLYGNGIDNAYVYC